MSRAPSGPRVGEFAPREWRAQLRGPGIGVRVGPFDLHLRIDDPDVHEPLRILYQNHAVLDDNRVFSCHAELMRVWHLGRHPGQRVRFKVDGVVPHEDMPVGQGLAVLEWGINLAIAMRFHGFLMLHAAVLERAGGALLLPAAPGFGKTTLCAGLAHRGWRLFSDEFGLLRPQDIRLTPLPRPMPLKNESIEVMRRFAPQATFGPVIPNTRKGTVVHVRPPPDSVARAEETAPAAWIVFPRWTAGESLMLEEVPRTEAFMKLATNAFNYDLLGEPAFETVRALVESARCFELVYSDLSEAVAVLTALADGQ
jgi:HprK-related kinase A